MDAVLEMKCRLSFFLLQEVKYVVRKRIVSQKRIVPTE